MIYFQQSVLKKIEKWDYNSIYVLADFDRTLTAGHCDSTWGLLSNSGLTSKEYTLDRKKLFEYYRPIELNEELDFKTKNELMIDWWHEHISLLIKYKLDESVINKVSNNSKLLIFRDGAKQFLENMKSKGVPVIIISAGIGNFIKQFLINNNCDFDNIFIFSNFIEFKDGIVSGIQGQIIHSMNKNQIEFSTEIKEHLKNRPNIVLFGDSISDIRMAKEKDIEGALKIGFLDQKIEENRDHFERNFDIVCTDNTSFDELTSKLLILKK